jgi:hypothetical protein
VAFEKAPRSCDFLRLEEMGVTLPPPEDVAKAELPGKLREIFEALANVNTFFVNTDHLSDRELYVHLWENSLREINAVMPTEAGFSCTYDLVSSGSDEAIHAWLKYYADEETRQHWAKDFPNDIIPPHEDRRTTATGICRSIQTRAMLVAREPTSQPQLRRRLPRRRPLLSIVGLMWGDMLDKFASETLEQCLDVFCLAREPSLFEFVTRHYPRSLQDRGMLGRANHSKRRYILREIVSTVSSGDIQSTVPEDLMDQDVNKMVGIVR